MTPERALAEIIARGDLCDAHGCPVLVVSLTTELLDTLNTFGVTDEDREPETVEDDDPMEDTL